MWIAASNVYFLHNCSISCLVGIVVGDDQDTGGQSDHSGHNGSKLWQSFCWRLELYS
jgi:hypothetical protein